MANTVYIECSLKKKLKNACYLNSYMIYYFLSLQTSDCRIGLNGDEKYC